MRSETIRRLAAFLSVILAFPCSALPHEDKVEMRSSRVGSSPGRSKKPILIGTPFEGEGSGSIEFSSEGVATGVSIGPGEGATTLEKDSDELPSSSPYLGGQVVISEPSLMGKKPPSIAKAASLAEKGIPAERANPQTLRLSQEKPLLGPSTTPLSEEKWHSGPLKSLIPASSHTFVPRKGKSVPPPSTARSWSTGTKSSSSSAAAPSLR